MGNRYEYAVIQRRVVVFWDDGQITLSASDTTDFLAMLEEHDSAIQRRLRELAREAT